MGTLHVAFSNGATGDTDFRLNYCLRDGATLTAVDGGVEGHGISIDGVPSALRQLSLHVGYAPAPALGVPAGPVPIPVDLVVVDLSQVHVLRGGLQVPLGSAGVPSIWHADVSGDGLHLSLDASGSC